ncbi:death-associated protein-like 1 isoform X2 [Ambystoma mexicanum]|uniref:death-associated protein-like 1 isoform X2 n=1 Tax=Ambystoma mexicanum TaxID=8296 RepID=UPI0037E80B8B
MASHGGAPLAVKAGKMRVAKKQGNEENGHIEKSIKKTATERNSSITHIGKMQAMNILFSGALEKLSREFPLAPAQMFDQKPRPSLDKIMLPKKLYVLQQPRKC